MTGRLRFRSRKTAFTTARSNSSTFRQRNGRCTGLLLVANCVCCTVAVLLVLYRQLDLQVVVALNGLTLLPLVPHLVPPVEKLNQSLPTHAPSTDGPQQFEPSHISTPFSYKYNFFEKIDSPWKDWSRCDMESAFQQACHPRPVTCEAIRENIHNNHGIGNSLLTTYIKEARISLQASPDCAPILKDKLFQGNNPHMYHFQLLDYVQEPNVVVGVDANNESQVAKCILYSITQPRAVVEAKVEQVAMRFENYQHLPLVAIHLRTGWSDELQRNAKGWEALGDCNDVPFDLEMVPHALSEVDLRGMVLDTAFAADKIFGLGQWRLYVASDAPGVRRYVRHVLQRRLASPIVWNVGKVGHNYLGGLTTNLQEKIETSISAFADIVVLSQADLLVRLSSKFPRASEFRTFCSQRVASLPGHPRHGLASVGGLLNYAFTKRQHSSHDSWKPLFGEDELQKFWKQLPGGKDNPCSKMADPVRSCYCLLKLSHSE